MIRPRPRLVLVTGAPGTGKTTLTPLLGERLGLPVLSRDALKALLADALDPPHGLDMGLLTRAHVRLFFGLLEYLLAVGPGLVVDSALDRRLAVTDLQPALARADAVIVHCQVDRAESARRFERRMLRGERHRAHADAEHLRRLAADPDAWDPYREPPALGVPVLRVDTTTGYTPTLDVIAAFARGG